MPSSRWTIGAIGVIAITGIIGGLASTSTLRRGIIGTGGIGTIATTGIGEV